MRLEPIDDPDGDARDAQDREDRRREQAGADVIPLGGYIDVDRIEAAAGPRPIRSPEDVIAEARVDYVAPTLRELELRHGMTPPRLVVAGDVVAELDRQHRRAYHRRQEQAARRRRWRDRLEGAAVALIALAGAVVLLALAAELSARP